MQKLVVGILVGLMCGGPLAAQGIKVPYRDSSLTAYPMPVPTGVDSMWAYVQRCSSMPAVPGDLSHLVWLKALYPMERDSSQVMGNWTPPDTIIINTLLLDLKGRVADSARVVIVHELLHYLLRGPVGPFSHPLWPFAYPCGVMQWQQNNPERKLVQP